MRERFEDWERSVSLRRSVPTRMSVQPSFFPKRITTRYPSLANGADISFCCGADEGLFWCKDDKDGRPIRATEWLFTSLARHVGILTPDCAILEDETTQETVFGSLQVTSPIADFEAQKFLGAPRMGEVGQPSEWPGAYLSSLYALDMFLSNPDRSLKNFFVLQNGFNRQICAFDFASASMARLEGRQFPIASDTTVRIGRFLRHTHRFYPAAANEMIDRIAAVPSDTIAAFLRPMPGDWMNAEQRERVCELWSEKRFGGRLLALRTGIADESLL